MTRPSITLCTIAKNEAKNVKQLYDSVSGTFDEWCFTDTGSTDETVEIAKSLGAKVSHFEWVNDFSAARNFNFSQAKTDYVYWLDLDDVLVDVASFNRFRDDIMHLADYWVARYQYTSDADGKSLCSFARERVFKTNRQMSWKYPIHEGIVPVSPMGKVQAQYIPSWYVKHMRTDEDLKKDRSRNLTIFEGLKAKRPLDAREQYYYGKELFEANKPVEACGVLLKAIAEPSLEFHDRLLGIQYTCYAYMQCNQFERVIEIAHQGLMLAPGRAEFHVLMGDAYIKLNQLQNALPCFSAAKACKIGIPQGYSDAIFHHEDAYTAYPRNQMARLYANLGDPDSALKEVNEAIEKFNHPESEVIKSELGKITSMASSVEYAKPCQDIVITCSPQGAYEWDDDIAKVKAMGGSETAAIEMSKWLHKLSGRPVKIFNMRGSPKTCAGVEYYPSQMVSEYMAKNKPYLHIAWRHNIKITNAPTFIWCHDLMTPGVENTATYEKMLCLTPFHGRYAQSMQGVPAEKIHVTRNGLKPELFSGEKMEKDPNMFVFSSSPDRGLDRTMRVLDKVREKHSDIKLHVFYGIEHLEKYGLGDMQRMLRRMMDERKDWVIYHGATQQDELIRHFKKAAYCVQPSDWIETSMISAMERLSCGIYQIMRKVGGVVDTLAEAERSGMAKLVDSECITESEYDVYVQETLKAIEEKAYERVSVNAADYSWEAIAREWLTDLPRITEETVEQCTA